MLPRGNLAIMTIAACLSGMSSISLTFLPVYFTSLGGTVTQYGLVTGIAMLSGIPATVAGGAIVPRRRLKRVMIATSWLGPTVLLGYYFSSNWIALSIVMVIATASNIGSTTSRQLIADATIRKNRAGQLSLYQTFLNLPAMFSPAVGGYLVTTLGMSEGFKLGLLFGIGASIASVALIIRYLRDKPNAEEEQAKNAVRSRLDDDGSSEKI
jgi:MFS family permease